TQEVEAAERTARDASIQRELLERLSVATQAVGLECFEFDWRTEKIVWADYNLEAGRGTEAAQKFGEARFASIIPEDMERAKEMTLAATARHEPKITIRYRRRNPDGSLRYIHGYHRLLYDQDGNVTRTLGANVDITESHER